MWNQQHSRCFEVNECAGLYWEGMNACSGRTVARVSGLHCCKLCNHLYAGGQTSYFEKYCSSFSFSLMTELTWTLLQAIIALEDDMEIETRLAEIGDNRVELEQKPRGPKRLGIKSRRSKRWRLARGSLLMSDERVQSVFHKDSNRHFLQISPFGLGRK